MSENLCAILGAEIDALSEKCRLLELDNVELKTKNDDINKFCEYLINQVDYFKAKSIVNSEPVKYNYDQLLNEYENESQCGNIKIENLVILFDNFPERRKKILTAIRDSLPKNIDELAEMYSFEEELTLLIKANEQREKCERFEYRGPFDLVTKYINAFNSDKKALAYEYIKKALLSLPLTYKEEFLDRIQAYLFDDYQQVLDKMIEELFGENKPMPIEEKLIQPVPVEKELIKLKAEPKAKRIKIHLDYKTTSVDDLFIVAKDYQHNPRQKALRIIDGMKDKKRSTDEIEEFRTKINKILTKKINGND